LIDITIAPFILIIKTLVTLLTVKVSLPQVSAVLQAVTALGVKNPLGFRPAFALLRNIDHICISASSHYISLSGKNTGKSNVHINAAPITLEVIEP
jgi:hypothetical protein